MLPLAFLTLSWRYKPDCVIQNAVVGGRSRELNPVGCKILRIIYSMLAMAGALGASCQVASASLPVQSIVLNGSTSATIIRMAHLVEPLVKTSSTTSSEDAALAQAIAAYQKRVTPDDFSSLTGFVAAYPHSGWSPAILTNLGLLDLHYGYFSRALDAWRQSWEEGRNAKDPDARALVDRAVGERARLLASIGDFNDLKALLADVGNRPITGSATEAVQAARESLMMVSKDPRHLFLCGPMALKSLLLARGASYDEVRSLDAYRANSRGTSLAEVAQLATQAKLSYRLILRRPGQPIPSQAIVHWKVGHFSAIVGQANGRIHIEDPIFPGHSLWITPAALDAEASGYFLVPDDHISAAWTTVTAPQAAAIWGKGSTTSTRPGDPGDPPANKPKHKGGCPLCDYNIAESSVALTLSDVPVGYDPPIGPSTKVTISYNQREDSQPANFSFFNIGRKWTLSWLSYVTDDPGNPGGSVSRFLSGGGAFYYSGYSSTTGRFTAQDDDGSVLVLTSQSPITYQRQLAGGSIEIYSRSDGSTSYPRNILLTSVVDPQGNALTLNYDSQNRLTSLSDAAGRQTTITYGNAAQPLKVTKITDPFGRSASLTYDTSARLTSITDVIGLTSRFSYDANSLVDSMTTPYGTSSFAYTAPGSAGPPRFVDVTDPLGHHEREEWLEPAPIPDKDPSSTLPQGMPLSLTNEYLSYRDSFHWDKAQYVAAGCTPAGGCDYTKARDTHFAHFDGNIDMKSAAIESVKYPLENRIWYEYPGQPASYYSGSYDRPLATGRVLDDGSTQLSRFAYDAAGYYKPTQVVDPLGRTTTFTYADNHIDLVTIQQTTAGGALSPLASFEYNDHHRALSRTDAAGQTSSFTYNAAGQLATSTDALGHETQYHYNATGDLTEIDNPDGAVAASYTYDAFDRIATATDAGGLTVTYSYDMADRPTQTTYPDGTTERFEYDKLDLASYTDRLGRTWRYEHDADRNLIAITDPAGKQALLAYDPNGNLKTLTDPNGNATNWTYDVQDRLISKQYADNSTLSYAYETTTSRLKSRTDALNQVKQFTYALDNQISAISYANSVNTTPGITFAYDPYFPRIVSMADGAGTTNYSYGPVGELGALQVIHQTGPPANSAIDYVYDALGRVMSRTIGSVGPETFEYDALGRLSSHTSDLGSFALSYLGETGQITQRALTGAGATLKTVWSYEPNISDRRLKEIDNTGLIASQYSNFQITSRPGAQVTGVSETSDTATVYPDVLSTQAASYNDLNQLTSIAGQALTYDANGNLLSDGVRTYSWDAENRLIAIGYTNESGKATSFTYNGLGQRVTISRTPAGGGSPITISYIWCGSHPCQALDATGKPVREYLAEGEYIPGTPPQSFYYGIDQIGSVRRVFASTGDAPAYAYDPYGMPLQDTAPLTDAGFAGMFTDSDSGLSLTQFRVYDPAQGRWLSRDPLGEQTGQGTNLYQYAAGNPVSLTDPLGLFCWPNFGWPGFFGPLWPDGFPNFPPIPPWLKNAGPLVPVVVLTLAAGGGPEDPLADLAVYEEIVAAEEGAATIEGSAASSETYSTWDATGGLKGVNTNVTADEFSANLQSNGYTATATTGSNGPVTVLQNGEGSTYTIYTRTSTGESGAQYVGPDGQMVKYNLGR